MAPDQAADHDGFRLFKCDASVVFGCDNHQMLGGSRSLEPQCVGIRRQPRKPFAVRQLVLLGGEPMSRLDQASDAVDEGCAPAPIEVANLDGLLIDNDDGVS